MSRPTWIQTASGGSFDLGNPDPADVRIEDIAEHLSKLCRFTGACRGLYSVAQHSCIVARILPPRLRLAGLLHDAAEAYTNDWSSPMKALVRLEAPGLIEKIHGRIEKAIEVHFGLELTDADREEIKHADHVAMASEKRDIMPESLRPDWHASTGLDELPPALSRRVYVWSYADCKFNFIHHFKLYTTGSETDAC